MTMPTTAEASPAEALKATSANLRGAIGEELTAGEDSHFSPEAASLLNGAVVIVDRVIVAWALRDRGEIGGFRDR